ncbi:cobalamin trafficking protein CblD-like isoform X3 [Teleopsis dalmanni]|uniref:cobalamin trafficking protein CblD-like isoform X3 n=1 Tax=Teleopsis dalmanni TaxID=139649 RepID=UPI0018CF97FA|nr:cobalamin trafficking protein CblD-like isoform X3 [Teleopsis dalmanni]
MMFLRTLRNGALVQRAVSNSKPLLKTYLNLLITQHYSRRSNSKNVNSTFKVVKSKKGLEVEDSDGLGVECGPNWELLSPRGNRFYLPNAVGPAWQGINTTISLDGPLESIVDFDGKETKNELLQLSVGECPSLIRKSLHELFPSPEVISSEKLALVTLLFIGDNEKGARKFVLAAKEISARLRVRGYWADFMNPFSGKPFYSWAHGKNLYKVDERCRGLNMKLTTENSCTVISTVDSDKHFSGSIYTNAPCSFSEIKSILDDQSEHSMNPISLLDWW